MPGSSAHQIQGVLWFYRARTPTKALGIATMIQLICEYHGITQGIGTLACDGLSALQQGADSEHSTSYSLPPVPASTSTSTSSRAREPWASWIGTTKIYLRQPPRRNTRPSQFSTLDQTRQTRQGRFHCSRLGYQSRMGNESSIDHATPQINGYSSKHTSSFRSTGRMVKRRRNRVTDARARCH
jgi:hypothetical protein